jgi:hypothetical protein
MSISVLVVHPLFGSVWLSNAEWNPDSVAGDTWDDYYAGSPYMPDDYRGEMVPMNFPLSCVQKVCLNGYAASGLTRQGQTADNRRSGTNSGLSKDNQLALRKEDAKPEVNRRTRNHHPQE